MVLSECSATLRLCDFASKAQRLRVGDIALIFVAAGAVRRFWIVPLAIWLSCSGCQPAAESLPRKAAVASSPVPPTSPSKPKVVAPIAARPSRAELSQFPPPDRKTLADLAAAATAAEFDLPVLDEGKIATAGIRQLTGQHITLYTDLPEDTAVDELPAVFDAAVPLWCEYFGIEPAKLADWKLVGSVMKDQSRFAGAGLFPESLPDFPHGFNVGSQIWLYDQPSAYFRRHLLLHEGTHAFMLRWLGGAGPPWYMEGMAELLGTHRWQDGKLTLGILPASKAEVPYWGRIKIVKQDVAAGNGQSLLDIMQYDAQAHVKLEAYAWCWAAAAFLDQHPLTQVAFRELKHDTRDRSIEFSKQFYERLLADWPAIAEDWQIFCAECDYGYDVPLAVVSRKPAVELPPAGATVTLTTNRGWQSTSYRLAAGKTYVITASGRYHIAAGPKPWPCEAPGVTIRYHNGQPLGMLLAGLSDLEGEPSLVSPLTKPQAIGAGGELVPTYTGMLYLKINEAARDLADNTGTLQVTIRRK